MNDKPLGMNGHPALITREPTSFSNYIQSRNNNPSTCTPCENKGAVQYTYETTKVQDLFFSDVNKEAIQKGIRISILDATDGKTDVGNQSLYELQTIMERVYYDFSENRPFDIKKQVRDLNWHVLRIAVPNVYNNMTLHTIQKDVDEVPEPMSRPVAINKGGKQSTQIDPSRYEVGAIRNKKSLKKQT